MKKLLSKLSPVRWRYKPHGLCLVQAEGFFLGYYFYFRGRYETLKIEFARSRADWWDNKLLASYDLRRTAPYEAGYYPEDKCMRLIYKGFIFFFFNRIKSKIC